MQKEVKSIFERSSAVISWTKVQTNQDIESNVH